MLQELNAFVEQRQRSQFVAHAIQIALQAEKKKLEEAYKSAAADKERVSEVEEWNFIDAEGWDE